MIHSDFDKEENILYMDRRDEIRIGDLFALVRDTVSNFKDLKCLYILDDARDSKPQFSSRDYPDLSRKIGDAMNHFKEVRHAILVDTPMNTALGILFEKIATETKGYTFKTFFSEAEARKWLKAGEPLCE